MSKVDWQNAPDNAAYYANGEFWREDHQAHFYYSVDGYRCIVTGMVVEDYEPRPQQWPDESRIDIIGTNGNTGEAYVHYDEFRATGKQPEAKSAKNKYQRDIVGLDGTKTTVDVYRVLDAFRTESAAIDHAVKKLLAPGLRHSKDRKQDLKEAIDSIAAELLLMEQR